jgi:lipoate-protein ligase A
MKHLDLTLKTPQENLALDETLLDLCDQNDGEETLRFWSPKHYFVVLGYSNDAKVEVHRPYCLKKSIPILKRVSGGGTVLQGPGCLNYSLILKIKYHEGLQSITSTNRYIMDRHAAALAKLLKQPVEVKGHTDLVINNLKFSGNAQRRKREAVLFHGTFLLDFDMTMIEKTLKMPSKEPDYRKNRKHTDFLMNLGASQAHIKECLKNIWI